MRKINILAPFEWVRCFGEKNKLKLQHCKIASVGVAFILQDARSITKFTPEEVMKLFPKEFQNVSMKY